jgi:mannose-1-phosphate guanylyltransferase
MQYIKKNNYFWNAGIFIWNVSTIVNAFRIYQPNLAKVFESMNNVYGTEQEQAKVNELFPQCENISVDYAIMEKAEEIFVCPSEFGWSDLGTWGSLQQQLHRDLYGNATIGDNITLIESRDCIVHTTEEKKVVIQGLEGYIVAERNDTLLICKLSEEQRIKQFSGEN